MHHGLARSSPAACHPDLMQHEVLHHACPLQEAIQSKLQRPSFHHSYGRTDCLLVAPMQTACDMGARLVQAHCGGEWGRIRPAGGATGGPTPDAGRNPGHAHHGALSAQPLALPDLPMYSPAVPGGRHCRTSGNWHRTGREIAASTIAKTIVAYKAQQHSDGRLQMLYAFMTWQPPPEGC